MMSPANKAKREIAAIAARPAVAAQLAAWRSDISPVLATAVTVQQIPAPTFAEAERGSYVAEQFERHGLVDISIDNLGNVFGRRRGLDGVAQPAVVSAHLDTVFPAETDLTVRRDAERIYGPGIGDNSLGVAGLLTLAGLVGRQGFATSGDIWLVANVGEEGLGDLRGMRAVADTLGSDVRYIVVEGGLFGQIFHQGIGVRRFRISVEAPGGHSWGSFGQPSAVHVMGRLIAAIADLKVPDDPKTTFNAGVVEGGTTVNSIAQSAMLQLDLRSESPEALTALVTAVHDIVARFRSEEVGIKTVVIGDRPPGSTSRRAPLIQLAAAALHYSGVRRVGYVSGSTDANIPLSRGWPAVCVGLTRAGNSHRRDEYIEIGPLPSGMSQLLLLTLAAADPLS